jgi:uncharacterized membrane protein
MGIHILQFIGLFLSGILAGEEFVVRYGVQPSLSALEDRPHIQARQALVRRLRILVPAIMVPTVIAGIAVLVLSGGGSGIGFRWAGTLALVAFVLFSFLGTVPINIKVNDWNVDEPPADWKSLVRRWEQIDVFRSSAAILAFAFFLTAIAVQLPAA